MLPFCLSKNIGANLPAKIADKQPKTSYVYEFIDLFFWHDQCF